MNLNFPKADTRYVENKNTGLYECPKCGKTLEKVFNFHNDNLYTLQCPTNREHCYRRNNVTEHEAWDYATLKGIRRCTICDSVLVYNNELYLNCPKDKSHMSPIKTTSSEIEKRGYLEDCRNLY